MVRRSVVESGGTKKVRCGIVLMLSGAVVGCVDVQGLTDRKSLAFAGRGLKVRMPLPIFVPLEYESAYGLLGCMARELADALGRAGAEINPERSVPAGQPRVHLFFNFPSNLDAFRAWARPEVPGAIILQVFVDHPFALAADVLDALVKYPAYRLLLPSLDGLHLLPLRWPGLRAVTMPHAVSRSSLVAADAPLEARPFDVVLAGSIADADAVEAARERVPAALRAAADAAAEMLAVNPTIPFTSAFDVCSPSGLSSNDPWALLRLVWAYATMRANRERRIRIAASMQGLRTLVLGTKAWSPVCTGTLEYGGDVSYGDLPAHLRRAMVAAAWNPTQFVITHSERVLLGMAAGCATVTDDRPGLRRALPGDVPVEFVNLGDDAEGFRAAVDRLLANRPRMRDLAAKGAACVEASQLWDHRVPLIASVIESVLAAGKQ